MHAESEKELLELLKSESRKIYKAIPSPIWCKSLECEIFFNSKGFHHLLYNGSGHKRLPKEQYKRLSLIPYILHVITNASEIKSHRLISTKHTAYWGLEVKMGEKQVRVVLKRIGNGKVTFWSVMEIPRHISKISLTGDF